MIRHTSTIAATKDLTMSTPETLPELDPQYPEVDVAIVMESTYPYLKGGVSAVVHDILLGNPDLTFGIIHLTWDSKAPHEDLYGMPDNVAWVKPVYLSMEEHQADFRDLRPSDLGMSARQRTVLSHRVFDAMDAIVAGDMDPFWALYDEGMNPHTRTYPLWALLGSGEFMAALRRRMPALDLPLTDLFWQMREFFSLAAAVLGADLPRASVYHAHTTGYASLMSAAGARMHGTDFLLTEHNLYVRDTVNTRLDRNMALPVTATDYRTFDVPLADRAWMAWWIEMGRLCYPSAHTITYLYPKAITEAADLGAPVERSVVIPNGMTMSEFNDVAGQRDLAMEDILAGDPDRTWRLVYIARVVPIKGLLDLIDTIDILVNERGVTNLVVDVLGPTEHLPDYYQQCVDKIAAKGLGDYLVFRGTVNVRAMLGDFDLLVLPSYNEGQPIVVLEAMTAGIPTVGTEVGGMAQLIGDPLTRPGGQTWDACGLLTVPGDAVMMADRLQDVFADRAGYVAMAHNARGRVRDFFQLHDVTGAYNQLYRELAHLPQRTAAQSSALADVVTELAMSPAQQHDLEDQLERLARWLEAGAPMGVSHGERS